MASSAHICAMRNTRGWGRYLTMERFVHANTDGPESPFARVDHQGGGSSRLPGVPASAPQGFMHAPPLPVNGVPGGHLMGWHLWVALAVREHGASALYKTS